MSSSNSDKKEHYALSGYHGRGGQGYAYGALGRSGAGYNVGSYTTPYDYPIYSHSIPFVEVYNVPKSVATKQKTSKKNILLRKKVQTFDDKKEKIVVKSEPETSVDPNTILLLLILGVMVINLL